MLLVLMGGCRRVSSGMILGEIGGKVINMGLWVWRIRITLRIKD